MKDSKSPFGSTVTRGKAQTASPPTSVAVTDKQQPTLLDFLPDQTVTNLPEDKKEALVQALDDGGFFSFTPMLCMGDDCPIHKKCPLVRNGIPLPFGDDCPVETAQMMIQHKKLLDSMPVEDLQDPFTMMLVQDLEVVNLILGRAYTQFAVDGGKVEKDYVVGYGPSGQALTATNVHNALPIIERYGKRKREVMAKLLATPQDRVRAEREGMHDKSRQSAALQRKIEKLLDDRLDKAGPPILDAQFEVKRESDDGRES